MKYMKNDESTRTSVTNQRKTDRERRKGDRARLESVVWGRNCSETERRKDIDAEGKKTPGLDGIHGGCCEVKLLLSRVNAFGVHDCHDFTHAFAARHLDGLDCGSVGERGGCMQSQSEDPQSTDAPEGACLGHVEF